MKVKTEERFMKRFCVLLLIILSMGSTAGFAQSNSVLDAILDQEKVEFSSAVYLALSAAELIEETATAEEAMGALAASGWGFPVEAPAEITLGQYSYLLMKAFNIPGGLMYRMFPGPRYATREAAFLGFVTDRPTPTRNLSGEEAVRMLGAVLTWKEDRS